MFISRTRRRRRRRSRDFLLQLYLLPLLILLQIKITFSFSCTDKRCSTGICHENGTCICNLPHPSTILDGDRSFLGGRFCDDKQIMCDGTNSFWCEHSASCVEIIHGENYTCNCPRGYAGLHCELTGAPCGKMFCFHEAECLVEDDVCGCPPEWRGSIDCSLPTVTEKVLNSPPFSTPFKQGRDNLKWFVVPLTILSLLGAFVVAFVLVKKYLKKSEQRVPKFQQLSEMRMHGFSDDEDDDSDVLDAIHSDGAHL